MNREIKITALAAAIALLAGGAQADPLSWTEVGVGYNIVDAGEDTTDAFDIRGSIGFAGIGHAVLTYTDGSVDGSEGFSGADFDGFEIRAGVHPSVAEDTQVIAEILYFDYSAELEGTSNEADEDGWGLGFGVRHQMGEQFEVRAQIDYFDGTYEVDAFSFSEDFNNTTYSFGGRYYWMPTLFTGVTVLIDGLEAASVADSGGDVIRVDVGWSFGADVF